MLRLRRWNSKRRITAGICATVLLLLVCAYVNNMLSGAAEADGQNAITAESKHKVAAGSQHTIAAEAEEFERLISKLSVQRSSENFTIAPLDKQAVSEHWLIRVVGADVAAVAFPFASPQVLE